MTSGVRIRRTHTGFLALMAAAPIVELLAGTSLLVTYILYSYSIVLLIAALNAAPNLPRFWIPARRWLLLPAIYVAVFMVTTYFGANFEYSIRYRVLMMPFMLIDFFAWYTVAYCVDERRFARAVTLAYVSFAVAAIAFARIGLIDAEATRVIYGPDVPFALVASSMSSMVVASAVLLTAALASLKKTVVICALIGFVLVLLAKRQWPMPGWPRRSVTLSGVIRGTVLALFAMPALMPLALPYLEQTIERFMLDGEDVMRLAMASEFVRLLAENFPRGTGYYTFGYLTQDTLPYTTYTADGTELQDGMSLHNTPMHIMLEGGLPITLIALALYLRAFGVLRRMHRHPPSRGAATMIFAWLVVCGVYGMFNQLHGSRYFFGVLGFAFGCYQRHLQEAYAQRAITTRTATTAQTAP